MTFLIMPGVQSLAAQRLPTRLTNPELPQVRLAQQTPLFRAGSAVAVGRTTFLERAAWGLGAGVLAFFAVQAAYGGDDPPTAPATAGYVGGTLLGIFLVARAHEGVRPLGTVIGALAGATLGSAVAFGACELSYDSLDDPGRCAPAAAVGAGVTFLFAVPIGASLGHGLDDPGRSPAPR